MIVLWIPLNLILRLPWLSVYASCLVFIVFICIVLYCIYYLFIFPKCNSPVCQFDIL